MRIYDKFCSEVEVKEKKTELQTTDSGKTKIPVMTTLMSFERISVVNLLKVTKPKFRITISVWLLSGF